MAHDRSHHAWFDSLAAMMNGDEALQFRAWYAERVVDAGIESVDEAVLQFEFDQIAAAERCVVPLLRDLTAASMRVPAISFDSFGPGRLVVTVERSTRGVPGFPFETPRMLVAILEEVYSMLDALDETVSCPMCGPHGRSRCQPAEFDRRVVWWCAPGNHVICPIGELASVL